LGGIIPALEVGFLQREIEDAAYRYQREIDSKQRIIVGMNDFVEDEPLAVPILKMDPNGYKRQVARLETLRIERNNEAVSAALNAIGEAAAKPAENLMPYFITAVKEYATLSEIVGVLKKEFGVYEEPVWF
jgi:methylmalonyl-CoA mutase N-terminal domain/subunit